MFTWLFWVTLGFALTDWLSAWRGWRMLRWVTKPGVLMLLIAWFSQVDGWHGPLAWFGLGLVFSLAGDVLLHLSKRFFLGGMLAFFLAHLSYIFGFMQQSLSPDWKIIFPLVGIVIIYLLYTRRVRAGLQEHGLMNMQAPVMLYAGIISLMVLLAVSTLFRPSWPILPTVLVSLGATLFYFSDACLAYDRFVCPLRAGDLLVMISYHVGQVLITSGVLLRYG
jgi:uncharacterized membrane protein YhhN